MPPEVPGRLLLIPGGLGRRRARAARGAGGLPGRPPACRFLHETIIAPRAPAGYPGEP